MIIIIIIIIIFRVGVSSPRRQRHFKAGQVETFLPAIIAAPLRHAGAPYFISPNNAPVITQRGPLM